MASTHQACRRSPRVVGIDGISGGPEGPVMDDPKPGGPPVRQALPKRPKNGSTFLVVKTESCPFCHQTMAFLKALHEQRGDFDVAVLDASADREAFQQVAAQTRKSTVPQIFLDGGFVGGWNELAAAAKSGQLDAYLDGEDWSPPEPQKKRWFGRRRGGR